MRIGLSARRRRPALRTGVARRRWDDPIQHSTSVIDIRTKVWTPVELVRWTADYLAEKGIDEARLTAELLLAGVLGLRRLDLYLQFERPLTAEELAAFKERLRRRTRREPLQYIEGSAAFRGLDLRVDGRVLIPRPETEVLVGEVLARVGGRRGLDVLDVGTGSGAIALSLRQEGQFGRVVATDVSPDALAVAAINREQAGRLDVELRLGPLFEPVTGERFDVIVSNPPYIALADRGSLAPEVVDWEPAEALFGGEDGLNVLRSLVALAPACLRPGGLLALEIGTDQGQMVISMLREDGSYGQPELKPDYAGRDRFVLAELNRPA